MPRPTAASGYNDFKIEPYISGCCASSFYRFGLIVGQSNTNARIPHMPNPKQNNPQNIRVALTEPKITRLENRGSAFLENTKNEIIIAHIEAINDIVLKNIVYHHYNGRAQRRGRCVADVRLCALTTEKRKELLAPSDCSEWLGGL